MNNIQRDINHNDERKAVRKMAFWRRLVLLSTLSFLGVVLSEVWAVDYKFVIINNKGKKCLNYTLSNPSTLTVHQKERAIFAENFRFYTTEAAAADDAAHGKAGKTAGTDYYTEGTTISGITGITANTFYVRYDAVSSPAIDIRGNKWYQMQVRSRYAIKYYVYYDEDTEDIIIGTAGSGNVGTKPAALAADNSDKWLWKFTGGDPYDVYIVNKRGAQLHPGYTLTVANVGSSDNDKVRYGTYAAKVADGSYNQSATSGFSLQSFAFTQGRTEDEDEGKYHIIGAYNGIAIKPSAYTNARPGTATESVMPYYFCANGCPTGSPGYGVFNDTYKKLNVFRSDRAEDGRVPSADSDGNISQIFFTEIETTDITYHILNENTGASTTVTVKDVTYDSDAMDASIFPFSVLDPGNVISGCWTDDTYTTDGHTVTTTTTEFWVKYHSMKLHLISRSNTEVFSYAINGALGSDPISLNSDLISPYAKNYHYYATQAEAYANTAAGFTTYAEAIAANPSITDIYVGYDYNPDAGLALNGTKAYSFRAGEGEGNYYLSFDNTSSTSRPTNAYTGNDNQLFFLTGSDPYRVMIECTAFSDYILASSWNNGVVIDDSQTQKGHTGTATKLYSNTTETSYFSLLADNRLVDFARHSADNSVYVMFWGGTLWFNIYGTHNPVAFTAEAQVSDFISSAMPIIFQERERKVSVTMKIVSIDSDGTGGEVLYTLPVTGDKDQTIALPVEYQSPLAKNYKFYTLDQFDVTGTKYVLKPGAVETTVFPQNTGTFYVKYEYDDANSVTFGSETLHVDLTGRARYTINTRTETQKTYFCWNTSTTTLDTSNDSYTVSLPGNANTSDPATAWNDIYLWTFEGSDPYAFTIRSAVATTRNFFLTPQGGVGGNGSNTWLVPDATERNIIRTWALLNGNKLISALVPETTETIVCFANNGWAYQDNIKSIRSEADVYLRTPAVGYHVINKSGVDAVSTHITYPADASAALSLPAALKSAHIIDDGNHYKYFLTQAEAAAYTAATSDGERTTAAASAVSTYSDLGFQTEIYVGYYYDDAHIPNGMPTLATTMAASARYYVQVGAEDYYMRSWDNNNHYTRFGTGGNELTSAQYQWTFTSPNNDPYDIRVRTPHHPDYYMHCALDRLTNGNASISENQTLYLNNSGTDNIHSFFFAQSDRGLVLSAAFMQNKAGCLPYLYYTGGNAQLMWSAFGAFDTEKITLTGLTLFHIVNKAGNIAISTYAPPTSPLTVPLGLRTPVMQDNQYRYFTTQAKAHAYNANPTDEEATTQGAVTDAAVGDVIYIGYNYVNDMDVLDLSGERWYNIRGSALPNTSVEDLYYSKEQNNADWYSIFGYTAAKMAELSPYTKVNAMFSIEGNDPYDMTMRNGYVGSGTEPWYLKMSEEGSATAWDWHEQIRVDATTHSSFMLLEHEDGYYTIAVRRPDRGEAYIGMRDYLYFWTTEGGANSRGYASYNSQYYTYYSDRNGSGNAYASKLYFEPISYETTFHIIDNSGREAIKYTGTFPANMPLDYQHIPATIRSPFLFGETLTFYTTATSNGTTGDDGRTIYNLSNTVTKTPSLTGADIYVRYTTNNLSFSPIMLDGSIDYNVRINGNWYINDSSDDGIACSDEVTGEGDARRIYLWKLRGNDPYAMQVTNLYTGKYVTYSPSALSDNTALTLGTTSGAGTYFIAMRNNVYGYYEVMAASGDDAATTYYNIGRADDGNTVRLFRNDVYPQRSNQIQMQLSNPSITVNYHIIDKQQKEIITATTNSVSLSVPEEYVSPFVARYSYWQLSDFTTTISGGETLYELTGSTELQSVGEAVSGGVADIYVTYDVSDAVYLPSLEEINRGSKDIGGAIPMYRLKYLNGESYNQEDGADHVMSTATKAIYPYANGEANFYIYGQDQLDKQMGGAATTRSRWPWYFESDHHDPYHVKVCSARTTYKLRATKWSATPTASDTLGTASEENLRLYFRTYPVRYNGSNHIVTGAITNQSFVTSNATSMGDASAVPTEYMVLGTSLAGCRLVTVDNVALDLNNDGDTDDEGESTERRTVTSFEQYWKNNPTVLELLYAAKGLTDATDEDKLAYAQGLNGRDLDDTEKAAIAAKGWHVYEAWASINSWSSTSSKTYQYTHHAFQTVQMGSDFEIEEMTIDPALVLLDRHGWEIMRKPIPQTRNAAEALALMSSTYAAAIRPYDSPMVKTYKFWHVGSKIPGYHKYQVSEPITVSGVPYTATSLTAIPPYDASDNLWEVNSSGVPNLDRLMDMYITYDVKEEYANSYKGAATEAATEAQPFLIHQGSSYAMTSNGTSISNTLVPDEAIATNNASLITDEMQWYVKPNFNIDREMGYKYKNEIGAQESAKSQEDTEADYFNDVTPEWNNDFDPYNLQISNKKFTGALFTINATGAGLDNTSSMVATYDGARTVSLTDASTVVPGMGHDNVTLNMTNATFMAVQDENGNMRLMPRFDHSVRQTNFITLSAPLAAAQANDQVGAQTTRLIRPLAYTYIIVDNSGHESIRYKGSLGEVSPSIPSHLASPLAKDFVYYSNFAYDDANDTYSPSESTQQVTTTFAAAGLVGADNTVYVRYSFNPDGDKYKILSEGDWHTISIDNKPVWVDWTVTPQRLPFGVLPETPDFTWQCKFIDNPDTEIADPYNATTINRVHPEVRWPVHYVLLAHGDELAFLVARKGDYNYTFLSSAKPNGSPSETITEYVEPDFATNGTYNGTVSQITFGTIPEYPIEYRVITNSGHLALKAKEPAARAKGEPLKPLAILPPWARSPLLNTDDFVYYTQATYDDVTDTYSVQEVDRTTRLLGLPSFEDGKSIVYVRYNYDVETCPYTVKDTYFTSEVTPNRTPLDLTGSTWYNIVTYSWGDDWLYASTNANNFQVYGLDRPAEYSQFDKYPKREGNFIFQGTKQYMWKLTGGDPYEFRMVNALKGNSRSFAGSFTASQPEGSSLTPYLRTAEELNEGDIQTFMILKPISNSNDIRIVATGRLNYYLSNTRWGANWISYYSEVDEDKENPYQSVGYHGYEFFKAPTIRNYTFHAVNCDDPANPTETWTATLSRNWLTPVRLDDDITRLYSLYEKFYDGDGVGEPNIFVDRTAAENGRFYADAELTERLYDSSSEAFDVYPEVEEDDVCHIWFKYKINHEATDVYGRTLSELTSTADDIAADVVAYKSATTKTSENGYSDDSPANSFYGFTPSANWYFMVLDTDADVTRNDDGTHEGNQYFVRRENDGTVSYLPGAYALHKETVDNYQTWSYNRLAEWYKEGDHEAFREGRWLWTFVGTDPYTMHVVNFEGANGVTSAENDGYSLEGKVDSYVSYSAKLVGSSTFYPLQIPDADQGEISRWGLCAGYGTGNTFRLQATGATDNGYAIYWQMKTYKEGGETTTAVMAGTSETSTSDIQLLPFTPTKFEDVQMVIRRNDDPDVVTPKGAASTAYDDVNKKSGITTDFEAATNRRFVAGDVVDNLNDGSSIPEILQRKFCSYTVWRDCYSNEGNCIISSEGDGAKRVFVSYDVTTDMFLKNEPTSTEVARMARENDHVYFMDFRDEQPDDPTLPLTSYDTGYHAYYKQGNSFNTDLPNHTVYKGGTDTDAYSQQSGNNSWVYQTTTNRMESVPENLKWYFVGDPYALRVFCTAEPGHNLARFHDTETQYQFILDCVHLRASDEILDSDSKDAEGHYTNGNKYDVREYVYDLDENGEIQYEDDGVTIKKRVNEYRDELRFPKFYWEVVPCRSAKADAFALRFRADNTSLSYKNIYYYLAHNGIRRSYTKFVDRENKEYSIDLSYRKENSLNQSDFDFTGLHEANNEMTIIRLVQPARVFVSAYDESNTMKTQDELSEYYGLNEVLDNVPRHLRRKYADYYNMQNLRDNSSAGSSAPFGYHLTLDHSYKSTNDVKYTYNYKYADVTLVSSCTDGLHTSYIKNPTFKFKVNYRPLDTATTPYPFTTSTNFAAGKIQWNDIRIGSSTRDSEGNLHWKYMYSDKYKDAALVSKYDNIEYLKGMHWALVGDPYEFSVINRRQYEGRVNSTNTGVDAQTLKWLGTSTGAGKVVEGDQKTVSYAVLTDATNPTPWADNTAVASGSGNTTWSLIYFKTGDEDNYFIRTSSLKTTEDESGDNTSNYETNTYGRLTTNAVSELDHIENHTFYVEPFTLATTNNQNAHAAIYTVDIDGDEEDNEVFDANVYVYKKGSSTPVAYLEGIELPYGNAVDALPWTLRRYGCDYTCYLNYNTSTNVGTQTDEFTMGADGNIIQRIKAGESPVRVVYEYEVSDDVAKFFTSEDDAAQEAYNWTNGYYNWQQPFTKSSQEGVTMTERIKVGDHVNEDGKIDGEIYEYVTKTIYPETDGTTDAYGWINSHAGDTQAFADQNLQTDNNDQKWALIGDPYGFEMKNYQFYLDGIADDLYGDTDPDVGIDFSLTDKSTWTIAIAEDGNTYLALCDENGNIVKYITFDRIGDDGNELSADEQNLKTIGSASDLEKDPTGNTLNISDASGVAKPFFLAGLKNYASVVIYHLVVGHQNEKEAYDTYYAGAAAGTLTTEQKTELKNTYGLTPQQLTGMTLEAYNELSAEDKRAYFNPGNNEVKAATMGWLYKSYEYTADKPINSIKLHEDELKKYGKTGTSLRDVITFPIADYVSYDIGVGNHLSVPWYMKRQFCNYHLYRRDVLESSLIVDGEGNPILDGEGNKQFRWTSILSDEDKAKVVPLTTVEQSHKDRMLIVDIVYDVDDTNFRFSDKGRNTTAWYSLMTQNEMADGLMNFSYREGIGARLDRTVHYTNNYLWAPVGDPYGFTLHNRYATINGTGWDNVVVTSMGKLPMDISDDATVAAAAAAESKTKNEFLRDYRASYTSADGLRARYLESRIIHAGKGEDMNSSITNLTTWAAMNADYEMLVSSYPNSFMMHPVSALIDVSDKNFNSNFLVHDIDNHRSSLQYGRANAFRVSPEASWRLETTSEQLWPYFDRTGYVGGLEPTIAMRNDNRALRSIIKGYVENPGAERDFDVLDRARELVYGGKFYVAGTNTEVAYTDPRPDEGLRFESTNLVNMRQGYYRIKAFSGEALDWDGGDMSETGITGIVGPRYISGYRFKSEQKIGQLDVNTGNPIAGSRWLHFHETDESHATIRTYGVLNDKIKNVDAIVSAREGGNDAGLHKFENRDILPHPSMRGNIEIPSVEYDPSSIFYFQPATGADALGRYTFGTQALQVRGVSGPSQGSDEASALGRYGVTKLDDAGTALGANEDNRFRIDDVGGTAMTLRLLPDDIDTYDELENSIGTNIQTNYVCIDSLHRYRITIHMQNELKEIGDHHTSNFGLHGIQDTKWLLQPVGIEMDEFHNEMPLRVEVHQGGNDVHDMTGENHYFYSTLYVPFDTRLTSTQDNAFTTTVQPTPTTVNLAGLSTLNNMGNNQFIPAYWPVVIRTSTPETDSSSRKFVTLDVPNDSPSPLGSTSGYESKGGTLKGELLEQTLSESSGKNVMVFGLPFKESGDKYTLGDSDATQYYSYVNDSESRAGFYTNENWARQGWDITDTSQSALGSPAYFDSDEAAGSQQAYEVESCTATYAQRSNLYVYHNKAYYLYNRSSSLAPQHINVIFEGDEVVAPDAYTPTSEGHSGYVYDLAGRLRATGQTPESLRANEPRLPQGVYIYRGKKVVVK